jgi:hypothetical protein
LSAAVWEEATANIVTNATARVLEARSPFADKPPSDADIDADWLVRIDADEIALPSPDREKRAFYVAVHVSPSARPKTFLSPTRCRSARRWHFGGHGDVDPTRVCPRARDVRGERGASPFRERAHRLDLDLGVVTPRRPADVPRRPRIVGRFGTRRAFGRVARRPR